MHSIWVILYPAATPSTGCGAHSDLVTAVPKVYLHLSFFCAYWTKGIFLLSESAMVYSSQDKWIICCLFKQGLGFSLICKLNSYVVSQALRALAFQHEWKKKYSKEAKSSLKMACIRKHIVISHLNPMK